MPGVDFDIKIEGDHIWLAVQRLEAHSPPALRHENLKGLIVVDDSPTGHAPQIDETVFQHRLSVSSAGKSPEEIQKADVHARSILARALAEYTPLWMAWSEGEKPRRKTISLYGDLFALKHQIQSDETAQPHELVWGIGVAAWKLRYVATSGRLHCGSKSISKVLCPISANAWAR